MDPVPIDTRRNKIDEILRLAHKLTTIFQNAAHEYGESSPVFATLNKSCQTFGEAIQAIQSWVVDGIERQLLEPAPWYQLTTSLSRAEKAITTFDDEVQHQIRSLFESRSTSKPDAEWDFESLQDCEADVGRETQALKRVFQLLKLHSITERSPPNPAKPRDRVEMMGERRTTLAVMTSRVGESQKSDTEDTTDGVAPPYVLYDVRTEETHTKWHVDQSVRAAEDKAPGQSILTLLPTALDVMSVASDETTCAADYRNTISTTSVRYAYRIGNLDFHWTDPRNTNLWTTKFTYSAQPRQDLPKHIKTIVEDLNKVIQLGSPLLTVLYEWHDGVGSVVTYAEKLLQKVVSLWYLCATIGGTLSEEMIQPSLEQIGGLSINVSEAGSRIELMESTARQFGIMKGPQVNLPGPDQEGALSIQEFVTESWEQHGIPLDNIISLLIYWDFILRVKQLPSPTDYDPDEKPKPEPEPKEGAAWIDLSKHEGLTVNRQDNVIGSDGLPIARPVEGNPEKITGRTITIGNNGSLFDSNTKFIGRCELIPENEPRSMKKRPFTGLEGLVVIQGGLVEDAELNIVGKVVEGDPKKLLGSVVDEDGDIIDISGEVRGRCKRLSPDDQIITGNKKQHPPSSNPRVAGGSDTIDDNDSSRLLNRLPHKQLVERSASGSAEYALPSFDSFGKTTQNGLKEKEIAHPVAAGIGAAPLGAGALATSRDESVQEIATIETPAAEEQLFSVSSKKSKKDKKKRQSTFNDFDNEQTASPAPEEFRDVTTSDSVPLVDDDNTEMPHERQEAVTAEQEEQLFEFSRKKSKKDKKKKRRSTFDDFDTVPTTSTDDLGAAVPVTMAKLQRDIDETPAPEEEEAFATPNRKSKKEKKKKRQSTFDNEIGEPVALSAQDQL